MAGFTKAAFDRAKQTEADTASLTKSADIFPELYQPPHPFLKKNNQPTNQTNKRTNKQKPH